jgi:anhydro-N-acetylmuramic acid kinase
MRVLGLMSGTSADGIDVALVRIAGRPPRLRAHLENFACYRLPRPVREAVLAAADGVPATTAEISQLNFRIGELFAQAALDACRRFHISPRRVDLIGSHGQTVYHQGAPAAFPGGRKIASTLQIGEPAIIAARTGIATVGDFRPADMAAGGQGAPLVPFVDFLLYRHARRGRVALNIGGIANLTAIPAAARPEQVIAFDTGPGNMIIDALVAGLTNDRKRFDRGAALALRGRLEPELLASLVKYPFFARKPPKTAGREQFGSAFLGPALDWAHRRKIRPENILHTITLLTPMTILDALRRWVFPNMRVNELILSGGGAHNPLIVAHLRAGLAAIPIVPSSAWGVPEDAKEAFAFAVLAYESRHGRPANLPGATGAARQTVLGKLCLP